MDGTAPHALIPVSGGLDEIINLGEFWDLPAMQKNKEKIIAHTDQVSRCFARAYGYLRSARFIAENIAARHRQSMDFSGVNRIARIFREIINDTYDKGIRHERHCFLAPTHRKDFVDHTDWIYKLN